MLLHKPLAGLLHKPLAGTAQFQAGAVHQEMHRPGSPAWPRQHLQRRRPPAESGVIEGGESEAKQVDDRTDQSLRPAQRQAEHGPQRQSCFDRQWRVIRLAARDCRKFWGVG
jgi:hypothetical protein